MSSRPLRRAHKTLGRGLIATDVDGVLWSWMLDEHLWGETSVLTSSPDEPTFSRELGRSYSWMSGLPLIGIISSKGPKHLTEIAKAHGWHKNRRAVLLVDLSDHDASETTMLDSRGNSVERRVDSLDQKIEGVWRFAYEKQPNWVVIQDDVIGSSDNPDRFWQAYEIAYRMQKLLGIPTLVVSPNPRTGLTRDEVSGIISWTQAREFDLKIATRTPEVHEGVLRGRIPPGSVLERAVREGRVSLREASDVLDEIPVLRAEFRARGGVGEMRAEGTLRSLENQGKISSADALTVLNETPHDLAPMLPLDQLGHGVRQSRGGAADTSSGATPSSTEGPEGGGRSGPSTPAL